MASIAFQPQNLTAEQADGNILLSWTASLGATGYQIQRSTDGVNFSPLTSVGIVNQYVDPFPGVGIQYWYRVAAVVGGVASLSASGLLYTAVLPGSAGNNISIALVSGGTAGSELVTITGTAIVVAIQNGTSTLNQVIAALGIPDAASAIIGASIVTPGSGTTAASLLSATSLTGGSGAGSISPYSNSATMIPAPPSEMSLFELRLRAQQCADRVNSDFVTNDEWNSFIRLAMYELYDLLMVSYEDYFAQNYVSILTNGTTANYPLPDGATNYLGGTYGGVSGAPAQAFYKLAGVDLNVNTSVITPSRVSLLRFDFIKRNQYVYPNSTSTIYGVYNMRYRLMGNNINIIPTPAGSQTLILWYSPKLAALLKDTDCTTIGTSGWLRYPIVRAAKYALNKEEGSDTSALDAEILFLKQRIEDTAPSRDAGVADTISETRQDPIYGGIGWGGGSNGGW